MTTRYAPRNLQGLPTLTEVIELPVLQPAEDDAVSVAAVPGSAPKEPPRAEAPPQPAAAEATLDIDSLVSEVYEVLRREAEPMLDNRLRTVIEPAVERVVQGLTVELRAELAASLRDLVERAVGDVLARRGRSTG